MGRGGRNNDKAPKVRNAVFKKQWTFFIELVLAGQIPEIFTQKFLIDLGHFAFPSDTVSAFLTRAVAIGRVREIGAPGSRSYKAVLKPEQRLREVFRPFYDQPKVWLLVIRAIKTIAAVDDRVSLDDLQLVLFELTSNPQLVPNDAELEILFTKYLHEEILERAGEERFRVVTGAEQHLVERLTVKPVRPIEDEGIEDDGDDQESDADDKEEEDMEDDEDPVKKTLPPLIGEFRGITPFVLNRLIPLLMEARGEIFHTNAADRHVALQFPSAGAFNQALVALHKERLLIDRGRGKWQWNIEALPVEWQTALALQAEDAQVAVPQESPPPAPVDDRDARIAELTELLRVSEERGGLLVTALASACHAHYFVNLPTEIQELLLKELDKLIHKN